MTDPANQSNPGVELSWGFPEVRDPDNHAAVPRSPVIWNSNHPDGYRQMHVTLEHDTHVHESPTGVTDFTLTTRRGAAYSPSDQTTMLPNPDGWNSKNVKFTMKESIISAPGDVKLFTKLVGNSSTITTEGELKVAVPHGKMQKTWNDPEAPYGLNLYAKGDIKISGFRDYWNNFTSIHMTGLIYTWGDFESITGHEDLTEDRWDMARYSGTIVAYGSEPGSGSPGSDGTGRVDFVASEVKLYNNYDSVAGVVEPGSTSVSLDFKRTLYTRI